MLAVVVFRGLILRGSAENPACLLMRVEGKRVGVGFLNFIYLAFANLKKDRRFIFVLSF
jgi:hypothetical protein